MKRSVQWSRAALDDLKNQIGYIAAENPIAARHVAGRIRATASSLGDFATGRPGRARGTYEKLVVGLPYVLAYSIMTRTSGEAISIVRVIHMSRDWPIGKWPG